MSYSNIIRNRMVILASTGLILALAGCATQTTPSQASIEKPSYSKAEASAKRAECKTMHETMMAEKGEQTKHQMTPEMMKKHKTCMELMPEMKAKMQAKCEAQKAKVMEPGMMNKEQMNHDMMDADHMQKMCTMMKQGMAGDKVEP